MHQFFFLPLMVEEQILGVVFVPLIVQERINLFSFVPLIVEVRIYSFIFPSIQTKIVFVFVFVSFRFVLHEEHRNRFQGTNSASQCSLVGQYNNTIPTRFLVPTDCLKIPARCWNFRKIYGDQELSRNRVVVQSPYL